MLGSSATKGTGGKGESGPKKFASAWPPNWHALIQENIRAQHEAEMAKKKALEEFRAKALEEEMKQSLARNWEACIQVLQHAADTIYDDITKNRATYLIWDEFSHADSKLLAQPGIFEKAHEHMLAKHGLTLKQCLDRCYVGIPQ